jgi:hypothetical protein
MTTRSGLGWQGLRGRERYYVKEGKDEIRVFGGCKESRNKLSTDTI